MSPQFTIYLSGALGAVWAAFLEGKKAGATGLVIAILIGVFLAITHFVLSRILGRWMLDQLERVKSSASIIRLSLAICFGLTFFVWWLAAPWSGDYLTKHALSLLGLN